jgi:hypothetical protein
VTPVIVAWPGTSDASRLAYGTPEHAHHRTWRELGTEVTTLPL